MTALPRRFIVLRRDQGVPVPVACGVEFPSGRAVVEQFKTAEIAQHESVGAIVNNQGGRTLVAYVDGEIRQAEPAAAPT